MNKTKTLSVGDRVRFTGAWLRSTCAYTGPLGQLRGTVTKIRTFSSCPPLVGVQWDQRYFDAQETNVLATNLEVCR